VSQEAKFKKGDLLAKEGEPSTQLYVIQSGKVAAFIDRAGQRLEIDQLGPGQIVGEQGIFGFPRSVFNYEALSEVKAIALPVEPMKTVFEKTPAAYKVVVKALGEDVRRGRNALRAVKMDQDNLPCPARFIPRLCAILVLVTRNSGQPAKVDAKAPAYKQDEERLKNPHFKDTDMLLSFNTLKIYTSRMFLESHQRMQNFCELLSKLGYVSLRYEKNEDTELMELQEVRVHDTQTIEHFGEFYQHNFFKAGKSEIIHLDTLALQLAGAFSGLAAAAEPDRNGIVKIPYQDFVKDLKEKYYVELKDTHLNSLEKKGLFVKRSTSGETPVVQFDRYEFSQTYKYWQIIQEIDKWNELGQVDMKANYNEYKPKVTGEAQCPSCQAGIGKDVNFCPQCGHKLKAAA
jgi:CRP-like cAMP-binding protein